MLTTAFLLGLFGSFHCLGMCGPIALAMRTPHASKTRQLADRGLYHIGRTAAYVSIGAVAGLLGQALIFSGFQTYLAYFSGGLMILIGLFAVNLDSFLFKIPAFQQFYQKVSDLLGQLLKKQQGVLLIGYLNGFLPCGLVYMALFGALATGSYWEGMAYMGLFGMGTIPMMLASSLAGQFVQVRWRSLIRKAYPVLFIGLGIWFIVRGANLPQAQGREVQTEQGVLCY